MPSDRRPEVEDLALDWRELARVLCRFRSVDRPADPREDCFPAWWKKFADSKSGGNAIRLFADRRLPVEKRSSETATNDFLALWRIARACYSATLWQCENDSGVRYRKELSRARRNRETLAGHASALAQAFKGNPPGLRWALWGASDDANVGNLLAKKRDTTKALSDFFSALAARLRKEKKLPEVDGGPWLLRSTYGNLIYRGSAPKRPPELETMLAYELVMYLRLWSAGQAAGIVQVGQPMPRVGKPHFGIAAAFVSAALDTKERLTGAKLANRLKRMPEGVGLYMWESRKVEKRP